MKKNLILGISVVTVNLATVNAQCVDGWAKKGGGSPDFDRAIASVSDHAGNIIVTGQYGGTAIFESSSITSSSYEDIFVAKYDHSGNLIWLRSMGGYNTDSPSGVAVDSDDNIYLTGTHFGTATFGSITLNNTDGYPNAFVAKYTASGNVVWAQTIGNTDWDQGGGIAVSGNKVYITGCYSISITLGSTLLSSAGGRDYFIARMDTSGTYDWADDGGGSMDDMGVAIEVDKFGNMYATGMFFEDMTIGSTNLINQGYFDVFTVRYSNAGVFSWAQAAGGTMDEFAADIVLDTDNNIYISLAGSSGCIFGSYVVNTFGDKDAMLAKYDNAGNIIWAKNAGGINRDVATGLCISPSNILFLSGSFNASATFGSTVVSPGGNDYPFVAAYDTAGIAGEIKYAGGSMYDVGNATCFDPVNHNLYLCGNFNGTTSFGPTSLTSADSYGDAFIWNVCDNIFDVNELSEKGSLTIFPNPIRDELFMVIPGYISGNAEISITNLSGQKILTQYYNNLSGFIKINTGNLEQGIYFVNLKNNFKSYTSKIIKE